MRVKLITYQLKNYPVDYPRISSELMKNSKWAKPMERVWLIQTDKKTSEIRDILKASILHGGSILVMDVTGSAWASLSIPAKVATWLKENL